MPQVVLYHISRNRIDLQADGDFIRMNIIAGDLQTPAKKMSWKYETNPA